MMKAVWNGTVIAESENTVIVEGNHYFPLGSITDGVLEPSTHESFCPWKGTATYSDIVVDGERNPNGAWHYQTPKEQTPKEAASEIAGRVAFWHGVIVTN